LVARENRFLNNRQTGASISTVHSFDLTFHFIRFMKKLLLIGAAIAGFCVIGQVAEARPRPQGREVYIIEEGRPVCRTAYFDDYDRCYTYYGSRRVYVREYYTEYPRHYREYRERPRYYRPHAYHEGRPGISFSFGFRD
jgi:hypothetical protein